MQRRVGCGWRGSSEGGGRKKEETAVRVEDKGRHANTRMDEVVKGKQGGRLAIAHLGALQEVLQMLNLLLEVAEAIQRVLVVVLCFFQLPTELRLVGVVCFAAQELGGRNCGRGQRAPVRIGPVRIRPLQRCLGAGLGPTCVGI